MDFTSALYMGITHSSRSLVPWEQLTTGRPDILRTPRRHQRVAAQLAKLVGCEEAALGPSTLHLFWDVFNILAKDRIALYFDRSVYPISHWGASHAIGKGVSIQRFSHHDQNVLAEKISNRNIRGRRPVVVTDGFCPGCGEPAPIDAYMEIVRPKGGCVVIDDTQALGIWGRSPDNIHPYGSGGGGSLRRAGIVDRHIILINSLAKAFGAPVGMIAGNKTFLRRFQAESQTRIHCSPPSAAAVAAAANALAFNAVHGNALRCRLYQLVTFFKKQIASIPMAVTKGLFPVQSVQWQPMKSPQLLYRNLQDFGVQAVLNHRCRDLRPQLSFLITIGHTLADIRIVARSLKAIVSHHGLRNKRRRWENAI